MLVNSTYQKVRCALIVLLMTLFSVSVVAKESQSITLDMKNASLQQVLESIEQQTSYKFSYKTSAVDKKQTVSVTCREASVSQVLDKALEKTSLTYEILSPRSIVIVERSSVADKRTVCGVVVDENGEPLIGALVSAEGEANNATTTDIDGQFSLGVPANTAIRVSYIGYMAKTVMPVAGQPMEVKLDLDNNLLDEVVVVGYGAMKKSDLTGAVAGVKGADIAARRTTNLSDALQGSVAGLTVNRENGDPSVASTINVRGITTISDSSPLVIIDGVPGDLNSVSPEDVESISVLKDAASASIYGARAAAGVIIVTTRRAGDGNFSLSYNFEYGWSSPTSLPEYVGATRFMEMVNELKYNDNHSAGWNSVYTQDDIDNWVARNKVDPDNYPITDWQDVLLKDSAPRYTHTVNLSGGNDKLRSSASLRYDKNEGLYVNKDYSRFMARVNNDYMINKYLTAHLDVNFSRSNSEPPNNNPMGAAERKCPPIYAVRWTNGMWGDVKNGENLLAKMTDGGSAKTTVQRVGGKIGLDITPLEGLRISGVVAPTWVNTNKKTFRKKVPYTYASDPNTIVGYMGGYSTTSLVEGRDNDYEITSQIFANYAKTIGKHVFTVMLGYEDFYSSWETLFASRDQFAMNYYPYLDQGSTDFRDNGGNKIEYAYHSYFGRVTYRFDNRYLLQANLRRDGSSRFASDSRWATFPSVSAGWVLSEEKFFTNAGMNWWNQMKLRASWGKLGNERIGSYYPYQASLNFYNALFQNPTGIISALPTAAQIAYAVRDISWETTESWDIGFDAAFFQNHLRATFDYYRKDTHDMLLGLEIPSFLGYNNPDVNAGSMRTHGYDIELSWSDRVGDFNYTVTANFSDFVSKMGNLNGTQFLGDKVKMEGSEFNEWYGYVSDGLFLTEEDLANSPKLNDQVQVGDIKYLDISGPDGVPDGKISSEYDRVLLGGSLPRYSFAFSFSGQYKGFDLGLVFNGVGSMKSRMSPAMVEGFADNWTNFPALLDGNYWSEKNTDAQNASAKYPRLSSTSRNANMEMSDFWLFNGRYLRLKNLTIGYTLPQTLTRKAFIDSVRFYVSGNDLFTASKFPKGWDPEVATTGYPICREFLIGCNVKF